jgi:hypothetical protein
VEVKPKPLLGSSKAGLWTVDGDTTDDDWRLFARWMSDELGLIYAMPGEWSWSRQNPEWRHFDEWIHKTEEPNYSYRSRRLSGTILGIDRNQHFIWEAVNGLKEYFEYNHQHHRIVDSKQLRENPDWAVRDKDGNRIRESSNPNSSFHNHPNLDHLGVINRIAQAAIEHFDENPDDLSYSIGAHDSYEFGYIDPENPYAPQGYFRRYQDFSNFVFHFSNRVAQKVAEVYPDKYLGALAYMTWENVPDFPVHPKIIPYLTADRTQWYDRDFVQEDLELVKQWADAGPEIIGTWDYFFGEGFLYPRSPTQLIADSIPALHAAGVRGYHSQVGPLWPYHGHSTWLMAQLLQDVNQDPNALMDQYFQAYYGPAAEPMRKFFDHAEKIWMNQPGKAVWLRYWIDAHQAYLYGEEDLVVMRGYLDEAEQLAASSQRLATNAQQPATSSQQLEASAQQPATSSQQPETSNQQLETSDQRLAASAQQLATSDQQLEAYTRRVRHVSDLFHLTEVFIEYVHLKWAISRGEHGVVVRSDRSSPPFEWPGMDFVSAEGVDQAIEKLDALESRFRELRTELINASPLNHRLRTTGWALAGEPAVVKVKSIKDEGGSGDAGSQQLEASAITPDWSLWDSRWRRYTLDTEGATMTLEDGVVRVENVRRGQLFTAVRAEPGTLYQAKVKFRGQIGPSSNVFVRLDWYDEDMKQIKSTAIDRLPPGMYEEFITIGPVAKAPEGTMAVRLFIRFYEMELGDVLFVD